MLLIKERKGKSSLQVTYSFTLVKRTQLSHSMNGLECELLGNVTLLRRACDKHSLQYMFPQKTVLPEAHTQSCQ